MTDLSLKMCAEILKDCKKYVIKRAITPSLYWMIEYEKEKYYRREREHFEYLLARDVEKYTGTRKIPVGELIAIKDEKGFHRGLVTDIYNRNTETVCSILLLEYGNILDIEQRKIFCIKNKELRNKKLSIVTVSVHGIQPAAVEIHFENDLMEGIFQKRVCRNWSPRALQFVSDLVMKNPYVFVKPVSSDGRIISGEIYIIQEPDGVLACLSQILCDKGFAVLCDVQSRLMIWSDMKGGSAIDIEKKIPDDALSKDSHNGDVQNKFFNKNVNDDGKGATLVDHSISHSQLHSTFETESSSSSTISNNGSSKPCNSLSFNSSSYSYSPSWVLKKCMQNTSYCGSFKKGDIYESEESRCSYPESRIFRLVQRSMEFFEKQKQKERLSGVNKKN